MENDTSTPFSLVFTSVTIILLSFFIQLNSGRVVNDRRAKETLKSARESLQGIRLLRREPELEGKLPPLLWSPLDAATPPPLNTPLMTTNSDLLFLEGTSQIRARAVPFLDRSLKSIHTLQGAIEIRYSLGKGEISDGEDSWTLTLQRAASLYRYLLDRGYSAEEVHTIGTLSPNEIGVMELSVKSFRPEARQ